MPLDSELGTFIHTSHRPHQGLSSGQPPGVVQGLGHPGRCRPALPNPTLSTLLGAPVGTNLTVALMRHPGGVDGRASSSDRSLSLVSPQGGGVVGIGLGCADRFSMGTYEPGEK